MSSTPTEVEPRFKSNVAQSILFAGFYMVRPLLEIAAPDPTLTLNKSIDFGVLV